MKNALFAFFTHFIYTFAAMEMMLTEVQITCIVLMGLISVFLLFFLPRYIMAGKVLNTARKLLGIGTTLVMLHFIVQYVLHKQFNDITDIRTSINLLFGIPITSFIDLSFLYLQRKGNIKKKEWAFGPIAFTATFVVMLYGILREDGGTALHSSNYLMALIYAATLYFFCILILVQHYRVVLSVKEANDLSFIPLVRWTRWSMLVMTCIGLGFPLMTFNTSSLMRSIYGILSISSAFFYVLSFVGYCFNFDTKATLRAVATMPGVALAEEEKPALNRIKQERMEAAAKKFIDDGHYLHARMTQEEAADVMGVSLNMLRMWLRTTKYKKYNNWIVALRIEKAKELLLQFPELNNEQIAEKCGFCDRQYFQQLFTKNEGISPSKWMKQQLTFEE